MPYTHFRYLAYQVPTVAHVGATAIYRIPPGAAPVPAPALLGNVPGLGADAMVRVQRLIAVMRRTANFIAATDNAQTLKVFLAPEFYFRPDQADVAYTYAQYKAIKDVLRQTIGSDPLFVDWLVVPGTILWKWDQNTPNRPNGANRNVYFNSAVYIIAPDLVGLNTHVVEKTEASGIDGIPTGRHGPGLVDPLAQASNEMWPRYSSPAKRANHVFDVRGVRVGLEICLEHILAGGVVRRAAADNWPHNRISLHLLVAGGMPIQPVSVAAKSRGSILRTDGYPATTNCQEVLGYGAGLTEQTPGATAQLDTGTMFDDIDLAAAGLAIPVVGDAAFWNSSQQLVRVYYTAALP